MTITTFHVIPFIVVSQTKCVHAVFFIKVIRLILRPSCKVPLTPIRPSKVTLRGDVIQAQPGFFSIVAMLNINVFLIIGHINKDRVFVTTFRESCCPVNTFFTRQITKSIEIAPSRITDICENVMFKKWLSDNGQFYTLLTRDLIWQQRQLRSRSCDMWHKPVFMSWRSITTGLNEKS